MKTTILFTTLITGICLAASLGFAQTAGAGGGAAAAGSAAASGRIVRPASPVVQPNGTVASPQTPGVPNRLTGQGVGTTTTNPMAAATNAPPGTNGLAGNTNGTRPFLPAGNQALTASDRQLLLTLVQGLQSQMGINSTTELPIRFIISNGTVTITGVVRSADESERIFARVRRTPGVLSAFNDMRIGNANAAAGAITTTGNTQNQSSFFTTVGNHAFSPADQSLLTQVEQQSAAQLGITSASTVQMPVHFSIQNGVVGVTGNLASVAEKQALLAAIQRIPGVVRVVDDVGVANPTLGGNSTAGGPNPFMTNTNFLPATANSNQTNSRVFQNNTNKP